MKQPALRRLIAVVAFIYVGLLVNLLPPLSDPINATFKDVSGFTWGSNWGPLLDPSPVLLQGNLEYFMSIMGVRFVFLAALSLYCVPILLTTLAITLVGAVARKRLLFRWPDFLLLIVPVVVWVTLVVFVPELRGLRNLVEMLALGTAGALTLLARYKVPVCDRHQASAYGLLAVTSLSACMWAFFPVVGRYYPI